MYLHNDVSHRKSLSHLNVSVQVVTEEFKLSNNKLSVFSHLLRCAKRCTAGDFLPCFIPEGSYDEKELSVDENTVDENHALDIDQGQDFDKGHIVGDCYDHMSDFEHVVNKNHSSSVDDGRDKNKN